MRTQKVSNRTEAAGNDKRRKRVRKGESVEQVQNPRRHLLHNDMLLVVQCLAGQDSKKAPSVYKHAECPSTQY